MGGHKLTLVMCDDWEGVYIDGDLVCEGHRIFNSLWLEIIRDYRVFSIVESYWINDDYMHDLGNFPDRFEELPRELFE